MRTIRTRGLLARLGLTGLVTLFSVTGALEAAAQTPFFPYYGKNRVKYDNFEWHIYETDHFEIYYYPELEEHLERVAGYAESAYQHISAELKHDLASRVPLIVFKTHSEFQQQNIIPMDMPEGVQAFAEPQRDRIVLPIDEPPDMLYRLIVHELAHIFEFDIIPRSLIRRHVPTWVDEGLADYLAGVWRPTDLMMIRDAAVADTVPRMSEWDGFGEPNRAPYNIGHAAFEFIESRWGKEGIRQFLFALRRNVIGGGENPYEEAFRIDPEEFDQQFTRYLTERFKPFRDKERPADYGRNLAPDPRRTDFPAVVSIAPSPSGDLIAAAAFNRRDFELDIILISSHDGQVIRNLTPGFDKNWGWENITLPGARWNTVPWMAWSPDGDRLAYFVRVGKHRTLVIQNVVSRRIEHRIEMSRVDEPESPAFSPDGRRVAFSALQNAVGDIWIVDLESGVLTNVTRDEFAAYAPTFSPDGRRLVYLSRISGNDKLFSIDLESREKTQITFGTHDEGGAQFLDEHTIVFSSTATDPNQPLAPDVARNGQIYNVWALDLQTGRLRQWTDALGGNVSPVVLGRESRSPRIAFVTFDRGDYGIHILPQRDPLLTALSEDFGSPAPVIDFQAPLAHALIQDNQRRKGPFEKLFLEGRPPVSVGVTSGGDVFGGSQITFTDVLGDRQFNMFAASIAQYRTLAFSYLNLERRLQYAMQGFSQTLFFYGLAPGLLLDPGFGFIDRDLAVATRTIQGGSVFGIWPLDRFRRFELFGGFVHFREQYNDPFLEFQARQFQLENFGTEIFRNGASLPIGAAFVQETTVFRNFGPLAGNTMRVSYEYAPSAGGNLLGRQTVDLDMRRYLRLGTTGLLALRARGFKSWGDHPDFFFYGGNSELRGYRYLEFLGHEGFFANAELRFPLIEAMLTPLGVMGGIRGVFFFNIGAAGFNERPFQFASSTDTIERPLLGFQFDQTTGSFEEVFGPPVPVSGFRLVDGRASYGLGLTTFALGFPVHFNWSWRTLFNEAWEDVLFARTGGSREFRRPRFDVWIGYDF